MHLKFCTIWHLLWKGTLLIKTVPKFAPMVFQIPDRIFIILLQWVTDQGDRKEWNDTLVLLVFIDKNLVDKIICPKDKSWKQGKLLDNLSLLVHPQIRGYNIRTWHWWGRCEFGMAAPSCMAWPSSLTCSCTSGWPLWVGLWREGLMGFGVLYFRNCQDKPSSYLEVLKVISIWGLLSKSLVSSSLPLRWLYKNHLCCWH